MKSNEATICDQIRKLNHLKKTVAVGGLVSVQKFVIYFTTNLISKVHKLRNIKRQTKIVQEQ